MGTMVLTLLVASIPVLVLVYAYAAYPLVLKVLGWSKGYRLRTDDPEEWPSVSITVPAYNEVDSIRATVE